MKKPFAFLICAVALICSCRNNQSRYIDLNTQEYMNVKKDSVSGYMMNARTGEPVDLYVDTKMRDTIYGPTGESVNGKVYKTDAGKWIVKANGNEYKAKSESENSAKVKMEGDEYKVKDGNYTIKRTGDGDVKIENGRTQVKVDGRTGERKVKKDRNITEKVKNLFH